MSFYDVSASLHTLVARLPFGLDASEQVGEAFERWRTAAAGEAPRQKHIVYLWTYCFVRRYFLAKFAANPSFPASDLDELVGRVYQKIESKRSGIRQPRLYAHWTSVVCRNTFLNYVNREHTPEVSLDGEEAPPLPSGTSVRGDIGLAREVVAKAIERLPNYLQPVARMRFLEGRAYQEISRETETAVPTVRTYAARVRDRLREDPAVQALRD